MPILQSSTVELCFAYLALLLALSVFASLLGALMSDDGLAPILVCLGAAFATVPAWDGAAEYGL